METQLFEKSKILCFANLAEYSDNGIVSKKVLQKGNGGVTLFAFDEGQALSEHSAPFDALVQIIEGKGEIVINKVPFLLSAGDSIIMPANVPHAVNAPSRFKMVLTMIRE